MAMMACLRRSGLVGPWGTTE